VRNGLSSQLFFVDFSGVLSFINRRLILFVSKPFSTRIQFQAASLLCSYSNHITFRSLSTITKICELLRPSLSCDPQVQYELLGCLENSFKRGDFNRIGFKSALADEVIPIMNSLLSNVYRTNRPAVIQSVLNITCDVAKESLLFLPELLWSLFFKSLYVQDERIVEQSLIAMVELYRSASIYKKDGFYASINEELLNHLCNVFYQYEKNSRLSVAILEVLNMVTVKDGKPVLLVLNSGFIPIFRRELQNRKSTKLLKDVFTVLSNILCHPEYHERLIDYGIISELQIMLFEGSKKSAQEVLRSYIYFASCVDITLFSHNGTEFHQRKYIFLQGIGQYGTKDRQLYFYEKSIIAALKQLVI
jgi:hypothetical protein